MIVEYNLVNDANLELTDINGRLVARYDLPVIEKKITINNGLLENGMYFYHISDNLGYTQKGKIVIMK